MHHVGLEPLSVWVIPTKKFSLILKFKMGIVENAMTSISFHLLKSIIYSSAQEKFSFEDHSIKWPISSIKA